MAKGNKQSEFRMPDVEYSSPQSCHLPQLKMKGLKDDLDYFLRQT